MERRLRRMLEREAPDPNRKRLLLTQRAQLGILRPQAVAAQATTDENTLREVLTFQAYWKPRSELGGAISKK